MTNNPGAEKDERTSDFGLFTMDKDEYGEEYNAHLLDEYKLFVGLMDKISERRLTANTFFLTANTLLVSGLGALSIFHYATLVWYSVVLVLASLAGMLLCWEWRAIIISYGQLNTGKFKIIHSIEERLPLDLFRAEWKALGEGKSPATYKPVTSVEIRIPVIFMLMYALIFVTALASLIFGSGL